MLFEFPRGEDGYPFNWKINSVSNITHDSTGYNAEITLETGVRLKVNSQTPLNEVTKKLVKNVRAGISPQNGVRYGDMQLSDGSILSFQTIL